MSFHRTPRPFGHRVPVRADLRSNTRPKTVPAPTLGWVSAQNEAAAKPGTAAVLENWFPTTTGIRLFGGSQKHATVDDDGTEPCESLMSYVGGATRKLFASCDGNIFDITSPADADAEETAAVTSQTSDYYSSVNYATAGGFFLYAVNGTDDAQLFDGTNWMPVNGEALVALDYDAETGTFTEGLVVTGGTSGATGTLERLFDDGTTGTMWLRGVSGTFQNDETITDTSTGSATSDGTVSTLIGAITNVDTSALSQVTVYRERLFFAEAGSLNVWALPVDVLAGAAIQVSLAGIFKLGGSVLFCSTWSLDSGAGLDDKFVVVSTEGEVAVYEGTDPSDANAWSLVGVYEMPPPLGKNAHFRAGGDLVILTTQGAIPVSQAVVRDRAALGLSAISRKIEPDWIAEASSRSTIPWEVVKWPSRSMTLVTNPVTGATTDPQVLIVNSETGAWCKRTNWDARCVALHNDQVYFGTSSGTVLQADIGGTDEGIAYSCRAGFAWDHLQSPGAHKTVTAARAQFKTSTPVNPQLSVSVDYTVGFPTPPTAGSEPGSSSQWDVGLWDVAVWDESSVPVVVNTRWVAIGESGFVILPQVQATVGTTATPNSELILMEFLTETGEVMV